MAAWAIDLSYRRMLRFWNVQISTFGGLPALPFLFVRNGNVNKTAFGSQVRKEANHLFAGLPTNVVVIKTTKPKSLCLMHCSTEMKEET